MACGTPIVAANNSSIPEIADKAALLSETEDARSLAEVIILALSDEAVRDDLITKGFNVWRFSLGINAPCKPSMSTSKRS